MSTAFRPSRAAALAVAGALVACGGGTPPVAAPPPPAVTAAPAVEPAPTAAPSAAPSAAPEASAAPDAPAAPTTRPPSGRPPILMMDAESITNTFGSSPAAKLDIGTTEHAILRIPEYAFDRGVNVTFKLDKKGKNTGGLVGKIYHTMAQFAGAEEYKKMETLGPPFELAMPAGNRYNANLAIGEILVDGNGREKVTWTIIPPKKIDDVTGTAHYELTAIGDTYLHVTTKNPTNPPAPKP